MYDYKLLKGQMCSVVCMYMCENVYGYVSPCMKIKEKWPCKCIISDACTSAKIVKRSSDKGMPIA